MNAYRACAIRMLEEMQDERLIKRAYDLIQYLYIHKEKAASVLAHRDGKAERSFDQPISTSSLQKNGGNCKR